MNIYKHEFRSLINSVITWSISLAVVILLFLSFFSAIAESAEVLNEAMLQFPEELLIAFGLTGVDFTTILGFFSMIFLFCQIMLAIQASNYGFSMLSIEERELTADFLLTRPVSRTKILLSKLLAVLTALAITDLVLWVSCVVFINLFKGESTYEWKTLLLLLLSVVLFQLVFLTLGMLISCTGEACAQRNHFLDGIGVRHVCIECIWRDVGGEFPRVVDAFQAFRCQLYYYSPGLRSQGLDQPGGHPDCCCGNLFPLFTKEHPRAGIRSLQ